MHALVVPQDKQKSFDMFTCYVLLSFVLLFNGLAFAQDFNAGMRAVNITIIGLAWVGVLSQAIRVIGKQMNENRLERERDKIKIAKERDNALRGSLTEQLKEVMNRFDELAERNRTEAERHYVETRRFISQLDAMTEELRNERQEKISMREQIEKLTYENEKLVKEVEDFKRKVAIGFTGVRNQLQITKDN